MLFTRMIFALVRFAARNGLAVAEPAEPPAASASLPKDAKQRARRTGIRGETYAYWYLRRHGYVFLARNYTLPGIKGEIDLVGYDGAVLAFIEVKTRAPGEPNLGLPEDAVTSEKRRVLSRMAWRFLDDWRLRATPWRFDVLAIESRPGRHPVVRLHTNAFPPSP
jgi:putative endonuclease